MYKRVKFHQKLHKYSAVNLYVNTVAAPQSLKWWTTPGYTIHLHASTKQQQKTLTEHKPLPKLTMHAMSSLTKTDHD